MFKYLNFKNSFQIVFQTAFGRTNFKLQIGFTLVELMVAISIVAILTTIGAAAYRSVLKDSRNAKRQSDLRAVQSALEQYHNDQRYYPASITFDGSSFTNATGAPSGTTAARTYLNTLPSDPQTINYIYQANPSACTNNSGSTCTRYCLYARLETTTVATAPTPCAYSGSTASYNLAITSP